MFPSPIYDWAVSQTNRPLANHTAVGIAHGAALAMALPLHPDQCKDWDNVIALLHTQATTDKRLPVLDAGACRTSAYLPGLRKLGYENLTGMNLDEMDGNEGGISYRRGNITKTDYFDDYFGFVACLSVIEHGVDYRDFFEEMARIILPGGHLFVSFDYWIDHVDTRGQQAFGAPVKIFDSMDVACMAQFASTLGLIPTSPVYLGCEDRVVNWIGLDYTFYNLLFRRTR